MYNSLGVEKIRRSVLRIAGSQQVSYSNGRDVISHFIMSQTLQLGKDTDQYNIPTQHGILCSVSIEVLHLESNQLGCRFIFFFMKNSSNLMEICL